MSWRTVVVANRAKLELKLGYLVIRQESITKVHLSEIALLIVESTGVSLTASLLCELMKRKVKVIFCDEKRSPVSELIPYYGSHDTSAKIRQQIKWDKEIKTEIWTLIVREKIRQQSKLLKELGKEEYLMLDRYILEVEPGDSSNREGHAAKVYFNSLFGMEFSRGLENSINAALNYGYAVLLSGFNREIAANGYLTQIGIFHDNIFNPYNLSSDLTEPFRPIVDRTVRQLEMEEFGHEEKYQVLEFLNEAVSIENSKQTVLNAIRIYTKSIMDALTDEDLEKVRLYD